MLRSCYSNSEWSLDASKGDGYPDVEDVIAVSTQLLGYSQPHVHVQRQHVDPDRQTPQGTAQQFQDTMAKRQQRPNETRQSNKLLGLKIRPRNRRALRKDQAQTPICRGRD